MGDIHRHAKVRVDGTGAYHSPSPPGLLPGAAHDVQVYVQLLLAEQFHGTQQSGETGPVVQSAGANFATGQL